MYNFMSTTIFKKKRTIQTFQKGVLLSITSLKYLRNDLNELYGTSYILTHMLNQESLENLFGQLRTRGRLNDHPTPLHALQRLRLIILGKSTNLQSNANTERCYDIYIVGDVIRELNTEIVIENSSTSSLSDTFEKLEVKTPTSNYLKNLLEQDALEYLAGWIAKKLKASHPHLGDYTNYNLQERYSNDFTILSWMTVIKGLEGEFNNYMFEGLTNSKNITQKLFKKIKVKYQNVDDIIIKTFVKQRLYIRMKHLNYKRNEQNNCKLLKYKVSSARNKIKKKINLRPCLLFYHVRFCCKL
jgi:hypothetical protein